MRLISRAISGLMRPRSLPLSTRDTVAMDTPASWATSFIVTIRIPCRSRIRGTATVPVMTITSLYYDSD